MTRCRTAALQTAHQPHTGLILAEGRWGVETIEGSFTYVIQANLYTTDLCVSLYICSVGYLFNNYQYLVVYGVLLTVVHNIYRWFMSP